MAVSGDRHCKALVDRHWNDPINTDIREAFEAIAKEALAGGESVDDWDALESPAPPKPPESNVAAQKPLDSEATQKKSESNPQ